MKPSQRKLEPALDLHLKFQLGFFGIQYMPAVHMILYLTFCVRFGFIVQKNGQTTFYSFGNQGKILFEGDKKVTRGL